MEKQRPIELINHNPKPFCDLDAQYDEPSSALGCLGLAAILGGVCGFGIFLLLVWMEG